MNMNSPSKAASLFEALPTELLIQVASHLDSEPPSVVKFAHEPSTCLTQSNESSLKNLSLVSWRWRKLTLPILFRYTRIPLDPTPQWVPIDARLIDNMQTQLTKLSNHEFQIYHKMRSKFKTSATFAFDEAYDDILINLCRIQEDDNFLKAIPSILWLPHLARSFTTFEKFVITEELLVHIKSIVVYTDREYSLRHVSTADAPLARAVSEIWTQIFSVINPTRVVVAAPPTTLAGLLDTQMLSADTWAFDMKMHYIELTQSDPRRNDHMASTCGRAWNSALIHRRPWTHMGYNEGSSITAYSTYEYHLKQSPKMLYLTLLRLARETNSCCGLESFSFVGVFPFSTNMKNLTLAWLRIPSLRSITLQLAPGPENDLLGNPKKLGRAQAADLWLEFRDGYSIAIGEGLARGEVRDGMEFRSADCWSKVQAQEVEDGFQMLSERNGGGWRQLEGVDGEGRWIRDVNLDREDRAVSHGSVV